MRVQVKKWGNSASVRIPASIMAAAALQIDQEVDVREEEGRIIIDGRLCAGYRQYRVGDIRSVGGHAQAGHRPRLCCRQRNTTVYENDDLLSDDNADQGIPFEVIESRAPQALFLPTR